MDSPWRLSMRTQGWSPWQRPGGQAFQWSGELGVFLWFLNRRDWEAAGWSLLYYCVSLRIPHGQLDIVSHSHGLQGVLWAAAHGLHIRQLIDISGPVRRDVPAALARENIGHWISVHSGGKLSDWTRLGGQLFDWRVATPAKNPWADVTVKPSRVGHSGVLNDAQHFHHWSETILPEVPPC
jgi:hypothetical protein